MSRPTTTFAARRRTCLDRKVAETVGSGLVIETTIQFAERNHDVFAICWAFLETPVHSLASLREWCRRMVAQGSVRSLVSQWSSQGTNAAQRSCELAQGWA